MKAIKYNHHGSPLNVLHVTDVDKPLLNADQVLIRMQLRAINPSDLLTIRGNYPGRIALPAIPGYEGIGIIIEKGKNVIDLSLGQRVLGLRGMWGYCNHLKTPYSKVIHTSGTWQEYISMDAKAIVSVPDEIDNVTAAQLYINPLTAWLMINELKMGKGDILIANACGSSMGHILAKFALIFGYELVGVARSDFYTETLTQLGVKKVINTSKEPLVESFLSYTKGRRASAALDAVGGGCGVKLAQCVQDGGTMLLYGLLSGEQHTINIQDFLRPGVTIKNYWLRNWIRTTSLNNRIEVFSSMMDHFVRYKISLTAGHIFDLIEIDRAIKCVEMPNRRGKVLLSG